MGEVRQPALAHQRTDAGAGLVEMALVLPLFLMLVLGMISGGIAYNRKLALTGAAREASRYGATLPHSNFAAYPNPLNAWLDDVVAVAVPSAGGELATGVAGRYVCVAYVYRPSDLAQPDQTRRRVETGGTTVYEDGQKCFDDSRPGHERRVQVKVGRTSELQAMVYSQPLRLTALSVTRFEAVE